MAHCLVNYHIIGHLMFVLVSTECVSVPQLIIPPAAKFMLLPIFFMLHAKNITSAEETHCYLCAVTRDIYGIWILYYVIKNL
jgi:hypothetical protein